MLSFLTRPLAGATDVALLVSRLVLGLVLVAHGWQKLDQQGFGATSDGFAGMGIPAADLAAAFAIGVELIGGALLVLGFLTKVVGLLVVADMAGAFWFAHRGTDVFVTDGGWELVAVIGAAGLVLAAYGAGRLSVDGAVAAASGATAPAREPATQRS